jgi:hypothetical protein
VQIAKKPAAKGLGVHGIFMRGKSRKYVIADSALKRIQVDAWAFWLDADEHHPGFAPRTDGALKCNRWIGGRRRFGHDASPQVPRKEEEFNSWKRIWFRAAPASRRRAADLFSEASPHSRGDKPALAAFPESWKGIRSRAQSCEHHSKHRAAAAQKRSL